MIFVDTNVYMYAVGRGHALRDQAREFLLEAQSQSGRRLCTSTEVLQELIHAYVPVGRIRTLDAALLLAESVTQEVWPVVHDDIRVARALIDRHPGLGARDLLHLACCRRRNVTALKSFDRALSAAFAQDGVD